MEITWTNIICTRNLHYLERFLTALLRIALTYHLSLINCISWHNHKRICSQKSSLYNDTNSTEPLHDFKNIQESIGRNGSHRNSKWALRGKKSNIEHILKISQKDIPQQCFHQDISGNTDFLTYFSEGFFTHLQYLKYPRYVSTS